MSASWPSFSRPEQPKMACFVCRLDRCHPALAHGNARVGHITGVHPGAVCYFLQLLYAAVF